MQDPNKTLAKNLRALMLYHDMVSATGEPNQSELARKTGIAQRSAGRLLHEENSATLDMLFRVSKLFRVEPWAMLCPHLDPADPPAGIIPRSKM